MPGFCPTSFVEEEDLGNILACSSCITGKEIWAAASQCLQVTATKILQQADATCLLIVLSFSTS